MKATLGITFVPQPGKPVVGIYDDPNGISVVETDAPYLVANGLQSPIPVALYDDPYYLDETGAMQSCLRVNWSDEANQ